MTIYNFLVKLLGRGSISYHSPPITLLIGDVHHEKISFLGTGGPRCRYHPGWLSPPNALAQDRLEIWKYPAMECFFQHEEPISLSTQVYLNSTSVKIHKVPFEVQIPTECMAFQGVFSNQTPYSLAMGLHYWADAWATLPKGCVYPLSIPEKTAVEQYISEVLQLEFIHPSISKMAKIAVQVVLLWLFFYLLLYLLFLSLSTRLTYALINYNTLKLLGMFPWLSG